MRKSRYTEAQITHILGQADAGVPLDELYRKYGIGQATFYRWKQKYGGMTPSEMQRLKTLGTIRTGVDSPRGRSGDDPGTIRTGLDFAAHIRCSATIRSPRDDPDPDDRESSTHASNGCSTSQLRTLVRKPDAT